ncbi:MAG: fatty acid cis/trans isomerase [Candidatus Electrothrix sp. GW3-4]|uniref:fatty acid cis/trans isomerase n=1 Tax=Candidatus Electrothrix sp. GW3-4 TaxID=3126740 RepID=UPI0030D221D3
MVACKPFFSFLLLLLLTACAAPPPPVQVQIPDHPIDYLSEVKPLLDKRCVVCHSCYNSPCQLKLSSYEGLDRGASKEAIYNADRLTTMDPTRLFFDARTSEEWRDKGFYTVTENTAHVGLNNSILLQLLAHKMEHPESSGAYHSEADDLTCAENGAELGRYLDKHPNQGMPFGFPPLKKEEFEVIAGWLAQGRQGPTQEQQQELVTPKPVDQAPIARWEAFLNMADPKHTMTARYLYEHYFLAHIKFETDTHEYYELVRSKAPPGQPIDLIATVRPYDDPETDTFFYRFRKIHSTIVHKTHMVVQFDSWMLARFKELFITPQWLQEPYLVGYGTELSANPFVAFAQIPAASRYRFLLDNAHYIIMTFIRGPVCRGQVALNVIHDHFWVLFLDPEYDLSVRYPGFLRMNQDNLIMPIERGSEFSLGRLLNDMINNKYQQASLRYLHSRQDFYTAYYDKGLGYETIWKGERSTDAPLLTVYRHFDSASVHRGVLGSLPRTLWLIDYPLLERIYYSLVAGFDVYGTLGHQTAVRLYMDKLRREGELGFLNFMPVAKRMEMQRSWYIGAEASLLDTTAPFMPAAISFSSDNPKREFIEHIVGKELPISTGIRLDSINYLKAESSFPQVPPRLETDQDILRGFRSVTGPDSVLLSYFNSYNANLAFVRIVRENRRDASLSIVVNRWHDNVSYYTMIHEKGVLNSSKDSMDILPGFVGSYPNYFFKIHEKDLPDFWSLLARKEQVGEAEIARFVRYGINRADAQFWQEYDWFQQRFFQEQPVQAGLFDLNRYYPLARIRQ